jgi:chemotaxis protein MotB
MATAKPIIVIKKKGGHGGHHGGAWKVAYADFVTAMMALFIVLWLLNSSQKVQKAVGGYFRDPSGTAEKAGSDMNGVGENFVLTKDNMDEIKEQLEKTIREVPDFEKLKNNIDMTVTNEGLRIELTESANGTFFDSGSSKISADGIELLSALAGELGKLPNTIAMEGHTDSKPYSAASTYTNGSFPPIAPTPLAASCSSTASAPIKSPRSAASPTNASVKRKTLSTPPTVASP